MTLLTNVLIGLIALLHIYFLWFEMFAWTTMGHKIFRDFPKDFFEPTKEMAANQGLYNGFLAAGLVWTFFIPDPIWKHTISLFFLICVAIAGIFGAFTITPKIFYIQGIPALIAILLLFLH